jgi:hypothetical protein
MRCLAFVVFAAACTESYSDVTIMSASPGPLGVGLTDTYSVQELICDPPPDGSCDPAEPSSLSVTTPGKLVAISNVDPYGLLLPDSDGSGTFELTGLAPGTTQVDVTGDGGASTTATIQVAAVASMQLFAPRALDAEDCLPNVPSPVQAFADSQIVIGQAAFDVNRDLLSGAATLTLDPGPTGTQFDPSCGCYDTGNTPGTAQLSTSLTDLTLNIVTADAIADFTIAGVTGTSFEIGIGPGTSDIFLVPTDASGNAIVGLGPTPTFAISDPSVFGVYGAATQGVVQSLTLQAANTTGTTSFDITWGNVHKTFTVTVVGPITI